MNHLRAPIEWRYSRGPRGQPISKSLTNIPWINSTKVSDVTALCCFWNVNGFFTYCFPCYAFKVSSSFSNAVLFNLELVLTSSFKFRRQVSLILDLNGNLRTKQKIGPRFWYEDIQYCLYVFDQRPNSIRHTEWLHRLMNYLCLDNASASCTTRCAARVWSSNLEEAITSILRVGSAHKIMVSAYALSHWHHIFIN